jgi:ATP-dependent protease ClpP protease subunit
VDKEESLETNLVVAALKGRRTLVLSGKITRDSMRALREELLSLQIISNERINLIIDSGGGETSPALTFCDWLTTLITAPVRGIALGSCGSAATFVMLHCNERVSTPYSEFVIHSGMVSQISIPIKPTSLEDLEQLLKEVKAAE